VSPRVLGHKRRPDATQVRGDSRRFAGFGDPTHTRGDRESPVGRQVNNDIQHVEPGRHGTTISPWSHRPTRCPGGYVRRCAARFTKTNDGQYLKPYNERDDDENGFWNGFRNDARFSAGYGSRYRSRHRSLYRRGRTCRRSARHRPAYTERHDGGYEETYGERQSAERKAMSDERRAAGTRVRSRKARVKGQEARRRTTSDGTSFGLSSGPSFEMSFRRSLPTSFAGSFAVSFRTRAVALRLAPAQERRTWLRAGL